ncbi:purine-nucleoside phosphorylase [Algoriphagus aestuarii]|nr:purine-nucleoside phosphorylase [Algoriphagus aestuarii]
MKYADQIKEAYHFIQNLHSEPVNIGIILGTGLGKLGQQIQVDIEIDYSEIPHFPISTVESHSGKLIFGKIGNKKVVAMKGRFHYYEGYSMQEVTFPVRVMKLLGVKSLLVSNACGGLNPSQHVGEVMIIKDHIDLFPENPLRGKNLDEFGVRFPDMSDAYSPRLIKLAQNIALENNFMFHTGVYAGVQGPNLETPAEYRYLRTIGADAVGMSTVPEVIVARQMDLEVFGISAITDLGVDGKIKKVTIAEVLAAAALAEPILAKIMAELVVRM